MLFAALLVYIVQAVQVEEVNPTALLLAPGSEEGNGVGADIFDVARIILRQTAADFNGFRVNVNRAGLTVRLGGVPAKSNGAPAVAVTRRRVAGGSRLNNAG